MHVISNHEWPPDDRRNSIRDFRRPDASWRSTSAIALMRARRFVLTVASLLLACHLAAAQSLTVAAASDLQTALPAIVSQFERVTGQHVRLTFGSSGNFYAE